MSGVPAWVVLAWRLPAGLSTPRVTTWRNLQRLGAARLTPGAAVLPFRADLQEQLDWLAQDVEQPGGEAWVLPVPPPRRPSTAASPSARGSVRKYSRRPMPKWQHTRRRMTYELHHTRADPRRPQRHGVGDTQIRRSGCDISVRTPHA